MAPVGHIQLGNPGALRPYLLHNYRDYQAATANPFAARINTSEEWGSLEDISEWVMDDWQAGQGQKDAEAGGSLYARLDTMVPNQIMTPPRCIPYTRNASEMTDADGKFVTAHPTDYYYSTPAGQKTAYRFKPLLPTLGSASFFFYFYIRTGASLTVKIYNDDGNKPGTVKANLTIDTTPLGFDSRYFRWYRTTPAIKLNHDTVYWVSIEPSTVAVEWPMHASQPLTYDYIDGAWVENRFARCPRTIYSVDNQMPNRILVRGSHNNMLYLSTTANSVWTGGDYSDLTSTVSGLPAAVPTCMLPVDDYVYIGYGSSAYAQRVLTTTNAVTAQTFYMNRCLLYNGYFWRSEGTKLYYSADLSTWAPSGGMDTGDSKYPIVSLTGAGGEVYAATAKGLYWAAPGDFFKQLLTFPTDSADVQVLGFQNSLYIIAEKRVFLMDSGGQVTDIWKLRHEDVDVNYWGTPRAMAHHRDILFVLSMTDAGLWPNVNEWTIWAWVQGGWHYVASGYARGDNASLMYDPIKNTLCVLGDSGIIWAIDMPVAATNPYYEVVADKLNLETCGWIEFPKFYGGPLSLIKDWHSLAVFGDNFDKSTTKIDVLWRNGAYANWQTLGTIDANNDQFGGTFGELFWDIDTLLPSSNYIQVALRIKGASCTNPVRITAVRLQYKTNIADRWRWPLVIEVSDYPQMINGEKGAYTAAESRTHLNGLITQDKRFIFEDVDGTQYEVVAEAARWSLDELEYFNGAKKTKWLLSLTLLQPTADTYTAPEA